MRRYCLAAILCALASVAAAQTLTGLVVGIADGDTITVLDASKTQHRVRPDDLIETVKVGDKVLFTVVKDTDGSLVVTSIKPAP
jgi:endonuclease YncB( thermonuclease family)